MSEKIYIYALCDPRTHEVRYVGKTDNLKRRVAQHINRKENSHKTSWIKSLKTLGLKPSIQIIDICSELDWQIKEQYWIGMFPNLVNVTNGGDKPFNAKGDLNPVSKLNTNQVIKIIDLYKYTNLNCLEISQLCNLTVSRNIYDIVNGRTWRHITGGKIISIFPKTHNTNKNKKLSGTNNHNSIISENDAIIIKKLLLTNKPSVVSTKTGISKHIVYDIKRQKTWKHVTI